MAGIRQAAELDEAVAEIDARWPASGAPEPGSPEAHRLEVLAILVDAYERTHHPIDPPAAASRWA